MVEMGTRTATTRLGRRFRTQRVWYCEQLPGRVLGKEDLPPEARLGPATDPGTYLGFRSMM
jgi:hypothetical protein